MNRLHVGLVLLWVCSMAAQGAGLSSDDVSWVNRFADDMTRQCVERFERAQAQLAEKSEGAARRAKGLLGVERRVNCECLPTRLRVRATPEVVAALRARNVSVVRKFMRAQAQACGAQGLRDSAQTSCLASEQERAFQARNGHKPKDAEIDALPAPDAAMQATCRCYAEQVNALDDATLIDEAEASYANFRARVDDASVPKYEGRIHAAMQSCRTSGDR